MKLENKSISQLKRHADGVFSLFIRKRDKRCFTCGSIKNLQCGHFVSRSNNNTRYCQINCNTQCLACNVFKYGNMAVYAQKLIEKHGEGIIKALVDDGRKVKQFTKKELIAIIKKYES